MALKVQKRVIALPKYSRQSPYRMNQEVDIVWQKDPTPVPDSTSEESIEE